MLSKVSNYYKYLGDNNYYSRGGGGGRGEGEGISTGGQNVYVLKIVLQLPPFKPKCNRKTDCAQDE